MAFQKRHVLMFWGESEDCKTEYAARDMGDGEIQLLFGTESEINWRIDSLSIDDVEAYAKMLLQVVEEAREDANENT